MALGAKAVFGSAAAIRTLTLASDSVLLGVAGIGGDMWADQRCESSVAGDPAGVEITGRACVGLTDRGPARAAENVASGQAAGTLASDDRRKGDPTWRITVARARTALTQKRDSRDRDRVLKLSMAASIWPQEGSAADPGSNRSEAA
jgi:hypothetical protein